MSMYIKYIHGSKLCELLQMQQSYVYDWYTNCYITISQLLTHRGQIHGGSSSSKPGSCLKCTHVHWKHSQNLRSHFMLASF